MKTLFISDLHLEEKRPDMTALFLQFLRTHTRSAKALYILGDFFEVWVGDDHLSAFNCKIMDALRSATHAGLPIYIMRGNRDFLLGKSFFRLTGCTLLPDEYLVKIEDAPFLLMHGDTLCTQDETYLAFRKKTRKWWVQKLFLMKPLKKRLAMAEKIRAESREHTSTAADYIMDVTPAEVERVMQHHHVQDLIHGHTHREAVHRFTLNGRPATRTVLGAWHEHGSVLVVNGKGDRRLVAL